MKIQRLRENITLQGARVLTQAIIILLFASLSSLMYLVGKSGSSDLVASVQLFDSQAKRVRSKVPR